MINTDIEQTVEKVANEAVTVSDKDGLNEAIAKLAEDHDLSMNAIKAVCAKANHRRHSDLINENSLSMFKIARPEKVMAILSKKDHIPSIDLSVTEEHTPIHAYNADEDSIEIFEKAAYEQIETALPEYEEVPDEYQDDVYGMRNKMYELGDEQDAAIQEIEETMNTVFATARELIEAGEEPEEVVAILKTTYLKDIPELQDFIIMDILLALESIGLIEDANAINISEIEPQDETIVKESSAHPSLRMSLVSVVDSAATEYLAIEDFIDKHGYDSIPTDTKHRQDILWEDVVAPQPMNKEAQTPGIKEILSNIGGTLALSASLVGTGYALDTLAKKIKRSSTKKNMSELKRYLPEKYPELKELNYEEYSDLFDSIVAINPHMAKAPYALYQLIKAQAQWGAMDIQTMKSLADLGKSQHSMADDGGKSILSDIGEARRMISPFDIEKTKMPPHAKPQGVGGTVWIP